MQTRSTIFTMMMPFVIILSQVNEFWAAVVYTLCVGFEVKQILGEVSFGSRNTQSLTWGDWHIQ
jgi:hypothetical protein